MPKVSTAMALPPSEDKPPACTAHSHVPLPLLSEAKEEAEAEQTVLEQPEVVARPTTVACDPLPWLHASGHANAGKLCNRTSR